MTKVTKKITDQTSNQTNTRIKFSAREKSTGKIITVNYDIPDPLIAPNLKNVKEFLKVTQIKTQIPNATAKTFTVYSYRQKTNGDGKSKKASWEVVTGDIGGLENGHDVTFGSNLAGTYTIVGSPRKNATTGRNMIIVVKKASDYTPTSGSTTVWSGFSSGTMTQISGLTNTGLAISLKFGGKHQAKQYLARTDYVRDFLIVMYTYSKNGNDNKDYYIWDTAASVGAINVSTVPSAIQSFIGANPLTRSQTDFNATRKFSNNQGYHITIYAAIVRCSRKSRSSSEWTYEWLQKPTDAKIKEPYMFSTKVTL